MIIPIPAIDLIDGKCVRLTQGDYSSQKVYNEDPLELAKAFENLGFRRLHVVDLDGAKSKHVVNHLTLDRLAHHTNLIIDFGGGIKTENDLQTAFDYGAAMVTIGSLAVTDAPTLLAWTKKYGAERFIIGADARDEKISINGWKEDSNLDLMDFIQDYKEKGLHHILCTDISCDGTLQGPSIGLYEKILTRFPECRLIASGGVSSLDDIDRLNASGVPAVVFGKAIYEGRINLKELSNKYL